MHWNRNDFLSSFNQNLLAHVMSWVMEHPKDLKLCNDNGDTALHLAAHQNDIKSAKWLLKAGAARNQKNKKEQSPLYNAVKAGGLEMVKLLADHGAKITTTDRYGLTLLHLAVNLRHGHPMRELLVSLGVDLHAKTKHGETALFLASEDGQVDVVKYLTSIGSDVNEPNEHLKTPLLVASSMLNVEIMSILIENGAHINQADVLGANALHKAIQSRLRFPESLKMKGIQYLVEQGCSISKVNVKGESLIDLAKSHQHEDIEHYLTGVKQALKEREALERVIGGVEIGINPKQDHKEVNRGHQKIIGQGSMGAGDVLLKGAEESSAIKEIPIQTRVASGRRL